MIDRCNGISTDQRKAVWKEIKLSRPIDSRCYQSTWYQEGRYIGLQIKTEKFAAFLEDTVNHF